MEVKIVVGGNARVFRLPLSDADLTGNIMLAGGTDTTMKVKVKDAGKEEMAVDFLRGETVLIDELNFFAKRLEALSWYEQKVMSEYIEYNGVSSMKDLINLTFSLKGLSFISDFTNGADVGKRLYLDENIGIAETEAEQINLTEFADKCFKEGKTVITPYGVYVEHGFDMQEVYNGTTLPMYIHKPDEVVAVVELEAKNGNTEYLYMPTDTYAMNRTKMRMGVLDYWECRAKQVINLRLPEALVPKAEDLREALDLSRFNEMCKVVKHFDESKMKRWEMAASLVDENEFTTLTCIARNMQNFVFAEGVSNDEEYGRQLVEQSGLTEVEEMLLPHIDYKSYGEAKRTSYMKESTYVEGGLVGTRSDYAQYKEYAGEFAEPLEVDMDCYTTFKFYCPLVGEIYADGSVTGVYFRNELVPYADEIQNAVERENYLPLNIRGLMHYFDRDRGVAGKVLSVFPMVEIVNDELVGVLECKIAEPLSEMEIETLKDYLTGQMADGWGESFEQRAIGIEDGDIYVSFWSSENYWKMMTEEEMNQTVLQEMNMV